MPLINCKQYKDSVAYFPLYPFSLSYVVLGLETMQKGQRKLEERRIYKVINASYTVGAASPQFFGNSMQIFIICTYFSKLLLFQISIQPLKYTQFSYSYLYSITRPLITSPTMYDLTIPALSFCPSILTYSIHSSQGDSSLPFSSLLILA